MHPSETQPCLANCSARVELAAAVREPAHAPTNVSLAQIISKMGGGRGNSSYERHSWSSSSLDTTHTQSCCRARTSMNCKRGHRRIRPQEAAQLVAQARPCLPIHSLVRTTHELRTVCGFWGARLIATQALCYCSYGAIYPNPRYIP